MNLINSIKEIETKYYRISRILRLLYAFHFFLFYRSFRHCAVFMDCFMAGHVLIEGLRVVGKTFLAQL